MKEEEGGGGERDGGERGEEDGRGGKGEGGERGVRERRGKGRSRVEERWEWRGEGREKWVSKRIFFMSYLHSLLHLPPIGISVPDLVCL